MAVRQLLERGINCENMWEEDTNLTVRKLGKRMGREQYISNNPGFRLKHPGVPDGSDGSDGTSYPLTENYTLPVAQATGRVV